MISTPVLVSCAIPQMSLSSSSVFNRLRLCTAHYIYCHIVAKVVTYFTIRSLFMTDIQELISDIAHRPFPIPGEQWAYYQEWNNALFLHWAIPLEIVRKCVPDKLNIDTYDGTCYVSLVAFSMEKIRPRYLPSIQFISDFAEINIRTYINMDGRKGVYFLNIESEKSLSAFVARIVSGLSYEKANINRTGQKFISTNVKKNFRLDAEFEIQSTIEHKTALDQWLTERYSLYLDIGHEFYRYDIHHKEWELKKIRLNKLNLKYQIGDIKLTEQPNLSHYSNGVKVIAWKRQKI